MERAIALYNRIQAPEFDEYLGLLEKYLQLVKIKDLKSSQNDDYFIIDGKKITYPQYASIDDLLQRHYTRLNNYNLKQLGSHNDYTEKIERLYEIIHGYEMYKIFISNEKFSSKIQEYKTQSEQLKQQIKNQDNYPELVDLIMQLSKLFYPNTDGSGLLYIHRLPVIENYGKTKKNGGAHDKARLNTLQSIVNKLPIADIIECTNKRTVISRNKLVNTIENNQKLKEILPLNYATHKTPDLCRMVLNNIQGIKN